MNKDLLKDDELRSMYAEYWTEEFQIVLRSIDGMYFTQNGCYPDFEWQRNAIFQFYRWIVAHRNARLMYRPVVGSWDEIEVLPENLDSAFQDWWDKFPKTEEDTNFYEPDQEPFYDFELWLLHPQSNRYTIAWDMDSPPEKFGDKPLNYPN